MRVFSFIANDLSPAPITIEYSARFQIPGFQILGLPSPEIQEARDRITSAFLASGLEFPKKRILINLAPASIRKSGTGHDLAIALKILSEITEIPRASSSVIARGELGLDGSIRPSGRMGNLIELLLSHQEEVNDLTLILCPEDCLQLERLLQWRRSNHLQNPEPYRLIRVDHLRNLLLRLRENESRTPDASMECKQTENSVLGLLPLNPLQERILKIASVGRHHTLLLGPKGVGKSSSLDWFRALATPSRPEAAWERALYQESRNEIPRFELPIRQVHSNVRPAHLLGSFHSGAFRAGELSLAHGGMLFADEFPEWPRDSKECLREPLQSEKFQLTSVRGTFEAKCDLQLIGTGNLCPCGGFPLRFRAKGFTGNTSCRCSELEVRKYLTRLSGPILDRIDLWALLPESRSSDNGACSSIEKIRAEVDAGRTLAKDVHGSAPSRIPPEKLETLIPESPRVKRILNQTESHRDRHKLIRIACSIAALENSESPTESHFQEARAYRLQDRWA
jgi:magnesium chelatase family protein